jgi:16S rRNA processing protein RimM
MQKKPKLPLAQLLLKKLQANNVCKLMQKECDGKICLGAIAGAHGVKGEVKIKTFTQQPQDIASYGPLHNEEGDATFSIVSCRPDKIGVVATIEGLTDREAAQKLKGTRLYIKREALPQIEEETWYHADLIGLKVKGKDEKEYGVVVGVYDFGAGDMVEVALNSGEESVFVPFTRDAVPIVSIEQGFIVAEPIEIIADDGPDEEIG